MHVTDNVRPKNTVDKIKKTFRQRMETHGHDAHVDRR